MTRDLRGLAVLAGAVALLTSAACARSGARAAEHSEPERPTVAVVAVTRDSLTQTLIVAAEFHPFEEVDLYSKVAGYLKSISVDVGDRVQAGQLVAVIEVPELEDELRQNDASVKRAEEEIHRSGAELDRAKSAHEVAHVGSTRLASVVTTRPNLISQQDLDEARGRDRVAEAQVATADAALASSREQLEVAKANQNKGKTLFAYARITAPFGGVITHRYADTGAMIQAGTSSQTQTRPIVQLSDNRRLRLVIPVPESAVSTIRLGASVDVTVRSLNKTFKGTVARFADRLDTDTRTMRVEVDVANPTLEIVPGMFAEAALTLAEAKDVVVAPIGAIDRTDAPRVMVVDDKGRVEVKSVTLGLETADSVEIREGLHPSELVVVGSRGQLRPGMNVSPQIAKAPPAQEAH